MILGLLFSVLALPLPVGTTIDPEGVRVLMRVNAGGEIAAGVHQVRGAQSSFVVTWDRSGVLHQLPVPPHDATAEGQAYVNLGGLLDDGIVFVTVTQDFGMEGGGERDTPFAYEQHVYAPVKLKLCENANGPQGRPNLEYATLDEGFLTYESPDDVGVLQGEFDPAYAPYAIGLDVTACHILGRALVRGAAGDYVVGYRGYLGTVLAPSNLDTDRQRYVAVRMHGGQLQELGPGAALGVTSDGTTVGADAPPGMHVSETESANGGTPVTYSCCTPHAMLWNTDGTSVQLAPASSRSIAYAVDGKHRVIGMLLDASNAHRAFLWQNGKLETLDNLVHAPGWRFESAYAFGPNGEIIGIGTYHGTATGFVVTVR